MEFKTRPRKLCVHSLEIMNTMGDIYPLFNALEALRKCDRRGRFVTNDGYSRQVIKINYASKPELNGVAYFEDMHGPKLKLSFRKYVLLGKPRTIIERKTYSS